MNDIVVIRANEEKNNHSLEFFVDFLITQKEIFCSNLMILSIRIIIVQILMKNFIFNFHLWFHLDLLTYFSISQQILLKYFRTVLSTMRIFNFQSLTLEFKWFWFFHWIEVVVLDHLFYKLKYLILWKLFLKFFKDIFIKFFIFFNRRIKFKSFSLRTLSPFTNLLSFNACFELPTTRIYINTWLMFAILVIQFDFFVHLFIIIEIKILIFSIDTSSTTVFMSLTMRFKLIILSVLYFIFKKRVRI